MAAWSEPRFYVAEVEGFLTPAGRERPGLTVAVHDRAYCHDEIAMWRTEDYSGKGAIVRQMPYDRARACVREMARELAERLNSEAA